jgi:hypothetical protein
MTDEHFWHVYFTLVKKYLPEKAFSWTDQDTLPTFAGAPAWHAGFLTCCGALCLLGYTDP